MSRQQTAVRLRDIMKEHAAREKTFVRANVVHTSPLTLEPLDATPGDPLYEEDDDFDLTVGLRRFHEVQGLLTGDTVLLHREGGQYAAFDVLSDRDIDVGAVPLGSAAAHGRVRLSLDAVDPGDPIAVGDNDPRLTAARTPTGAAAGDLVGTYPNPTIKASVALTGTPTAATPLSSDDSTRLATTAFVHSVAAGVTAVGGAGGDLTGSYPSPSIAAGAVTHAKVAAANIDGLAAVPSMRTLGSSALQAAAGNDARFLAAATSPLAGKFYRDTFGTFDQAAVVSIIGNRSSSPTTQVMGTTDPGGTNERGSVGLYLDNSTRNRGGTSASPRSWIASSSATVFTATSVRFTDGTDLSQVKQGMLVDVGGAPGTGGHLAAGFVSSVTSDTVNLNFQGWRKLVAGVPTAVATPANGSITYIDREDQIWGMNLNVYAQNAGDNQAVVGIELDLVMARDDSAVVLEASEGAGSRGYDVVAIASAGKPTFGSTVRGRVKYGVSVSGVQPGGDGRGAGFVFHKNHMYSGAGTVEAAFLDDVGNAATSFKKRANADTDGLIASFVKTGLSTTEPNPRYSMDAKGSHWWGPGVTGLDATLVRESDGGMRWGGVGVRFDNWIHVDKLATGAKLYFGSNAATTLYASAGALKTDTDLVVTNTVSAQAGTANGVALGWDGAASSPAISFGASLDAYLKWTATGVLKTGGVLNAVTGFQVNGVALAASHLSNGVTGSGAVALAASPTLTGTPLAPTAATADNSTQLATTAFVKAQAYAPLASPTFTGTPAGPTAAVGTATTQLATTAFVQAAKRARARIYRSAARNVTNATWEKVPLDASELDNDTMYDSTNGRLVCKTAGTYALGAALIFGGAGGGNYRLLAILVNGKPVAKQGTAVAPAGAGTSLNCSTPAVDLAVNDTIEMWAYQDSGGAQALTLTDNPSGTSAGNSVWLAAARIGN